MDDFQPPAFLFGVLEHGREQAVIRADEGLPAEVSRNRAPGRADAGVHDSHVDGSLWEERNRAPEGKRACKHVLRGNFVADIGNLRSGANAPDDAFQRADEAVFGTEVSGEGQDGHGGSDFGRIVELCYNFLILF